MSMPEFSRPLALDSIGEGVRAIEVEASAEERAALAGRFGIRSIEALRAELRVSRRPEALFADGRLHAEVVQTCVASGEDVPAAIDEAFAIRFLPAGAAEPAEDEVELSAEDCDTVFYTGNAIDLGEAVAETLALALDPFPRSPNADAALKEAGVLSESEAGPFAGLAALRDRLKGES